jgi:hypothetical protein
MGSRRHLQLQLTGIVQNWEFNLEDPILGDSIVYGLDIVCFLISTAPPGPGTGTIPLCHCYYYIIASFFRSQSIAIRTGDLDLIVKQNIFKTENKKSKVLNSIESSFPYYSQETELLSRFTDPSLGGV